MVSSSSGEISSAPREARRHSTSRPAVVQHPHVSAGAGRCWHVPGGGAGGKHGWRWVLATWVLPRSHSPAMVLSMLQ